VPLTPRLKSNQKPRQRASYTERQERVIMKDQSVYSIVTDRIVSLLEQGTIPWQKPWHGGDQAPQNLVSRKPYHGINVFLLNAMNYASPLWLSYLQAQQLGGNVRRGEKGCPIVFWKRLDTKNKETGEAERIPLLRYFTVFNLAQVDGVQVPTTSEPTREFSPIEKAQEIVDRMPKHPEIRHGLSQAFYQPSVDLVGMPAAEQFKTREDYYATLFHELSHSTGHASRLNRKGVSGSEGQWSSFGSNPYAKEELVSEISASYLCAEAHIVDRTIDNSAAYVAGWILRLKNDSKLIIEASSKAQRAADFIMGKLQTEAPAEPQN
jgi:antirestriction protein ArdC